jgi:hypothetical protein
MNREKELVRLKPWVEKTRGFAGWDLSSVEPRLIDPGPPWNYEQLVREYGVGKDSALDLGAGRRRVSLTLRQALPCNVVERSLYLGPFNQPEIPISLVSTSSSFPNNPIR